MNKRKTRCYVAYCEAGGIFNNEVFYTANEGYRIDLATCINCGSVLVVDRENPKSAARSLADLVTGIDCPECGCNLQTSIRSYPSVFVGKGGIVGSFSPSSVIPPSEESRVLEFWEIEP